MKPLEITVTADTEQAQKELKAVGTVSDTAGSKVESSMRSAQDSIEDTGRSASNAADKTKDLGDAAGDTASNAGQLAGALDLVHPAAGDVARVVADAADALEVFTRALGVSKAVAGPIAIAVMAMGAAYLYLKDQLDDAEEAQRNMSEAATAAEAKFAGLKAIVSGLADEMRVLNGVSQTEIDLEQQQTAINAEYQVAITRIDDLIFAQQTLRREEEAQRVSDHGRIGMIAREIRNLEELREKTIRARDEASLTAEFFFETRQHEIKADQDAAAAAEALQQARDAAADAEAADTAAMEISARALEELAKKEQERLANKIAETAAETARLEELAILEMEIAAERESREQAEHEAAMQRLEERRTATEQTIGSSVALMGSLSEGFSMMADSQAAADSEAAMKSFEISRKLALAEVIFNLAKGVMAAQLLPPIAKQVQIASLVASAGVQVGMIGQQEPPTAHMGDTGLRMHMGGTADSAGQQTVILRNEAVLDSATTRRLGPDGVQSLLNGAGPGRASKTVVTYRHLDQAVGDLLKNNGSRSARSAKSASRSASSIGTTRAYQ
tara:strand:+ start:68 stop:1747 length:1680 start_codon:yes stop_codon:yes gene_type:complete